MFNIDFLTIEEQENYLHFLFCIHIFSETSKLLKKIQNNLSNPLAEAAFAYALVQYAVPYTNSKTKGKHKLKLPETYIPKESVCLHYEIIEERNQLHAHMDLALLNPRLAAVEEDNGVVYSTYLSNHIMRFNKISKISEIVHLVDGTLENRNQLG